MNQSGRTVTPLADASGWTRHVYVIASPGDRSAMAVPCRKVHDIAALNEAERLELWELAEHAQVLLRETIKAQGFNVGLNLGKCAGAGVIDHLHLHIRRIGERLDRQAAKRGDPGDGVLKEAIHQRKGHCSR